MFETHDENLILKNVNKLRPIRMNRWFWWRKWEYPKKPLHKRKPLLERINNGDFDFSHYFWQAQYSLLQLNKIHKESKDLETYIENSSVEKSRYNRLMKDYYKDEDEKLQYLYKSFEESFIPRMEETKEIINNFDGSLNELYQYYYKNHSYVIKPIRKSTIK